MSVTTLVPEFTLSILPADIDSHVALLFLGLYQGARSKVE